MNDRKFLPSCGFLSNNKMINRSRNKYKNSKIMSGNIKLSDKNKSRVRKWPVMARVLYTSHGLLRGDKGLFEEVT